MLQFFFWSGIGRGLHAMLIGHVALAIPVCRAGGEHRPRGGPPRPEGGGEAASARRPLHAFFAVTFPLLLPSVIAASPCSRSPSRSTSS